MQRTKTLSFKLVVLLIVACLVIPLIKDINVKATEFEDVFLALRMAYQQVGILLGMALFL